jgi:Ca2+-binding EF-hand superfamily protein
MAALAVDPDQPNTWEVSWSSAFNTMKNDGEVHRDSLVELLHLVGYRTVDETLCLAVADKLSAYPSFSANEIFNFLQNFEEAVRNEVTRAFSAVAQKYGGKVPIKELANLIEKRGYTPVPHAILEILTEASAPFHIDVENMIAIGEGVPLHVFEAIVDILEQREGFCKSDFEIMEEAFERFDRNKNGVLDSSELPDLLASMDFCLDTSTVDAMVAEPLKNGNGSLTWKDFLGIMRRRVMLEFELCEHLFEKLDEDADGLLKPGECMRLFKAFGVLKKNHSKWQSSCVLLKQTTLYKMAAIRR